MSRCFNYVNHLITELFIQGSTIRRWIILDGPVDSLWIENLNSLLDENRRLCLPSGETFVLPPLMNIIFETPNLNKASPATVTRCGMVYFEPKTQTHISRPLSEKHESINERNLSNVELPTTKQTPLAWIPILEFHLVRLNSMNSLMS